MNKLFLKTFLVVFFVFANAFAGDYCVISQDRNQTKLVQDFLEKLQPLLPKNLSPIALEICYVIDHDQHLTNTLMSYSAEFDRTYRSPSKVFAQDTKNIDEDFGIKINLTSKFIKLLEFAKVQRGEKETVIQPEVLGYAGSFIVRSLYIANKFKSSPVKDIRKSKNVPDSGMSNISNDHEGLVTYMRSGIQAQQDFVDGSKADVKAWAFDASVSNPEFLDEKIVQFTEDGKFIYDEIFFKGQYRPAQIVSTLFTIASSVKALNNKEIASGLSEEQIQDAKNKIQELSDEWKTYFNDSEASNVLQNFVMVESKENYKALDRFKERYDSIMKELPIPVKPQ